ncbi:MAG: hypothetical protein V7647_2348, partial [Acidobacteriota bacterium]
ATSREHRARIGRVLAAWTIAALAMAPVLYGYWTLQRAYGMRRSLPEIIGFSADVASVLRAADELRLWGWLKVVDHPESALFPGVALIALVVAGLAIGWSSVARQDGARLREWRVLLAAALALAAIAVTPLFFGPWKLSVAGLRLLSVATPYKPLSVALLLLAIAGALHPSVRAAWRRRSPIAFYALAAAGMWLFSLGPAPTFVDHPFIYKAPYAWLMALPGMDGVRVPARFWMLAALCLAVAAGLAIRQLRARWPRMGRALPALACVGLLTDAWPTPITMETRPAARPLRTAAVARLELPVNPAHDAVVLFRSVEHRRPIVNGYSGYFAPHYWALQYLLEHDDPAILTRLSARGALEVVIDRDQDEGGRWGRFVSAHPQAELVYENADYSTYRIRRGARPEAAVRVDGEVLPLRMISATVNAEVVTAMTDGDIVTRWHAGRAQRPGDSFTIDLGAAREVSGVELLIGGYVADFPRQLSIATSTDAMTWTDAWSGGTALMTFNAALDDPLKVTLPFGFPSRTARFVRLTQNGADPVFYWSVAELHVRGH